MGVSSGSGSKPAQEWLHRLELALRVVASRQFRQFILIQGWMCAFHWCGDAVATLRVRLGAGERLDHNSWPDVGVKPAPGRLA